MDAKPFSGRATVAGLPGFEERFAAVKGGRLRYFVAGSGEPLVLLHGLGGAASNWFALAPELASRRRVLVPDLPGHGGSSPLPAVASLDAFADRVGRLAEREGVLPAPVVGHSLGGLVALRTAARFPGAVRALVLAAPAGISSLTRRARYALRIVGIVRPAKLIAPYRRLVAHSPFLRSAVFGYWGASDPAALSPRAAAGFLAGAPLHTDTVSAAAALVRDDPRPDLAAVDCPSLVLWGARDHQLGVADGFEYARRLNASVRVIADCGHLLIGERPDACLAAIDEFLS
jgi:pimeloyl-ACP methyl ester carboxylesterase